MTIARQEPSAIQEVIGSPSEIMAAATEQATILMDVVKQKGLFATIEDKQYLEAEAWEIILAFNNAHPAPVSVTPILDNGTIVGYEAFVEILKNGSRISSGIMACGFDDWPCQGKSGTAMHRAAMSAAQTWAMAKAARLKFAWVAILGGFAPTPAEEMGLGSSTPKSSATTGQEFYCDEHSVPYRRYEKKETGEVWYSHKKADGKWHNMPKATEPAPEPSPEAQAPPEPARHAGKDITPAEWQTFYDWAAEKHGIEKSDGVHMILGKTAAEWTGTLRDAAALLEAAKKAR